MAKSKHISETPATQWLKQQKAAFNAYSYDYVERGGAAEAARQLGVDLHAIAKTLVMENESAEPLLVLMHGDKEVSTKSLARQIKAKKISPCQPDTAQRHSGYMVGGTSPFATRKKMPVYIESSLLDYPVIYVNGGRRGYMLSMASEVLKNLLQATIINASLDKSG